jgi:hypothetical protein
MPRIPDLPPTEVLTRNDSIPVYINNGETTNHATLGTLYNAVCSELSPVFATNNRVSALELKQNENLVTSDLRNSGVWVTSNSSYVADLTQWLTASAKNNILNATNIVKTNSSEWVTYDALEEQLLDINQAIVPVKTTILTVSGVQEYSINGWDFNQTTNPNNYLVVINGLIQNADTDYTIKAPSVPSALAKINFTNTINKELTCTVISYRVLAGTKEGIDGITVLKNSNPVNSFGVINTLNFVGDSTTVDIVGNGRQVNVNVSNPESRGFVKGVNISSSKNLSTALVTGIHFTGAGLSAVHFENNIAEIYIDKNSTTTTDFSGVAIADDNVFLENGKGYKSINFVGDGVSARGSGNVCLVEISGSSIDILSNDALYGKVNRVNFGNGIIVTKNGLQATVSIPNGNIVTQDILQSTTWVSNNSARLELDGYKEITPTFGFNYTVVYNDKDKHIVYKGSDNINVLLPGTNLADTVNKQLAVGSVVHFIQKGDGNISFVDSVGAGGAGAIVRSLNDTKTTAGKYAVAKAIKTDLNEWVVTGDLV